jgi:hypothetical protein
MAVKKLWKNDIPSKVNFFGWRLLLEKLPTRAALVLEVSCLILMMLLAFYALGIQRTASICFLIVLSLELHGRIFNWMEEGY